MSPYIEYVGAVVVRRHELTNGELREIGEFTRENVARWFEKPHEDWENWIGVTPVEGFHAVCGDVEIPWTTEEAKNIWQKLQPHVSRTLFSSKLVPPGR